MGCAHGRKFQQTVPTKKDSLVHANSHKIEEIKIITAENVVRIDTPIEPDDKAVVIAPIPPIKKQYSGEMLVEPGLFKKESKKQFSDNYEILEFIGEGAFGRVAKIEHKETHEIRAVKILNKSCYNEVGETECEIEVLKKLDHPNILKFYEFYQDPLSYYLVVEYCSGGELFDEIIRSKRMSERHAALIIRQLLSAITYCHKRNIVHRDIKPENLLLENKQPNSAIKVIDFGTSAIFEKNKKLSKLYGTPYYIAPEVLAQNYDEKCDVWSCGVLLYILLSGKPPFNGETDEDILESVRKGVFTFSK